MPGEELSGAGSAPAGAYRVAFYEPVSIFLNSF
jgi:hypothetical protein